MLIKHSKIKSILSLLKSSFLGMSNSIQEQVMDTDTDIDYQTKNISRKAFLTFIMENFLPHLQQK